MKANLPSIEPSFIAAAGEISAIRTSAMPVQFQAAAGEGKLPTFEIVGYTGVPMNVAGFYVPVIVDLVGAKAASQTIPALFEHDTARIVGQTDSVKIDAKGVTFTGQITGENADAIEVKTQAKNGFKWQASVGASIDRREFVDAGKTATVNGREVTGPILIARESTIREISFVALGADGNTSANVAAKSPANPTPTGNHSMTFQAWLKAKGIDPAAVSAEVIAALELAFNAEQNPTPAPASKPPANAQGNGQTSALDNILTNVKAENARVDAITGLIEAAIKERPLMVDTFEQIGKAAIEAKTPVNEVKLALYQIRAEAPAIQVRRTEQASSAVIEAALCRSGNLPDWDKKFPAQALEAVDRRFRNGLGLKELLHIAARENGHAPIAHNDVGELLRAAFTAPAAISIRAEGLSTISLPGILSNVANKFLLAGFTAVESSWRDICSIRPVNDFKSVTSYSLTGDLKYEKVGPGGELKHGTLGELSYSNQADTYGKILGISRRDIINDDLGALTSAPQRLGRGAALKLNEIFWTVFLAGVGTFWTSGRGNLITGGTTNLSSTSLESANTKFLRQTDADGYPLGIQGAILLVPPELAVTANALLNSAFVNTGGSSTTDRVPNANVWQGLFRPVRSAYLSNASFTGYSTTAWYLLANPQELSTIEVAFLNGREMPFIESTQADFETLGIQMRGYHDFGVATQEYRGSVRSAGA